MKVVFRILKDAKNYWGYFIIAFISLVVSTIAGFYSPWALRQLTEIATSGAPGFASEALRIGSILLIATIIQSLGASVSGYCNHHGALNYVAELRTKVYTKLQHMSFKFFNDNKTGELTNRVINDSMEAEILLAHVIPDLLVNMLTFVGVGFILFTINVKLALLSLVTIPFLLAITIWQTKYLSPIWDENSKVRGELSGTVQDNFSGIREIQIFNQQKQEESKISKLSLKHAKAYLKASFFFETTYPLLAFFTSLSSVGVIIYGGILIENNQASIGDIVAFIMYLNMFYGPIKSFSRILEIAGEATASCNRVFEILDSVSDVEEISNPLVLSDINGDITFNNVSFGYIEGNNILNNINLNIKAGESVAFVGATGVGKTTIASLLNRFYDPVLGDISIDDVNIKNASLESLRNNISMVLQDTFLFNGTVYENISYSFKGATKEDVINAAKAANAHSFIENLEDGYDTIIGERGVKLSGGQKQRLSIARAVLRNTPILILDEATSALDVKTEKEIQSALDDISKNRTTIIIAHRLSTIRNVDKIVVLHKNSIAEIGSHDELIRSGGIYSSLYHAQVS